MPLLKCNKLCLCTCCSLCLECSFFLLFGWNPTHPTHTLSTGLKCYFLGKTFLIIHPESGRHMSSKTVTSVFLFWYLFSETGILGLFLPTPVFLRALGLPLQCPSSNTILFHSCCPCPGSSTFISAAAIATSLFCPWTQCYARFIFWKRAHK